MKGKHKHKWDFLRQALMERIVYDDPAHRVWWAQQTEVEKDAGSAAAAAAAAAGGGGGAAARTAGGGMKEEGAGEGGGGGGASEAGKGGTAIDCERLSGGGGGSGGVAGRGGCDQRGDLAMPGAAVGSRGLVYAAKQGHFSIDRPLGEVEIDVLCSVVRRVNDRSAQE